MNLRTLALVGAVSLALFSCQVDSKMDLKVDQTGLITGTIKIDQGFASYYQQLLKTLGMTDKLDGADIFQEQNIRNTMSVYPKVKLTKLVKTSPTTMEGVFTFQSATSIMNDTPKVAGKPVLSIKDQRGTSTLEFHLNRDNVKQVFAMNANLATDPTASTFLPSTSNVITEKEYTELVEYMLETHVPTISTLFASSYIAMDVNLPRPIKSLTGDATAVGSTMKLKFPMVRLLSLEKPINVVVTY